MRHRPGASHPFQRGAIGLFGVMVLLLVVLLTALVVDSGRLWMQKKQLQSIADMAAINAARHLNCNATLETVTSMAQIAATNNGFSGQLSASPNQVLLGRVNTEQGIRRFTADGSHQAVYVKATREVPGSLIAGGVLGGSVILQAEAVSVADLPIAAFSAGSFTASLNSEQSVLLDTLLGGMLGASFNLSLADYQGLAKTKVALQDILAVSTQVSTVQELLNTDMQVGDMLGLFANAVSQQYGVLDLEAQQLRQEAADNMQKIASLTVRQASVRLGEVLAMTTSDVDAAAKVGLNALSLITTTAMVANGQHALAIPLAINIPSIAGVNAEVTILQPSQLIIGPATEEVGGCMATTVRAAQVRARAGVLVNIPLLARIDLALGVEVAPGTASLRSIEQGDGETLVTIEAQPGIAKLTLTNNAGTGPAGVSTLLGLPLANIGLNLPLQPTNTQMLEYVVDNPVKDHLPQTQSIASPLGSSLSQALAQPNLLSVTLLGVLDLGLVSNIVSTIVSPLLSEIGRILLDPLLKLLGVRVGGMDVTLEDVQYHQSKPLVI